MGNGSINVKDAVNLIVQGRKEFILNHEFYNSLSVEVREELDKNYWRFKVAYKGYYFEEMEDDEKEQS